MLRELLPWDARFHQTDAKVTNDDSYRSSCDRQGASFAGPLCAKKALRSIIRVRARVNVRQGSGNGLLFPDVYIVVAGENLDCFRNSPSFMD